MNWLSKDVRMRSSCCNDFVYNDVVRIDFLVVLLLRIILVKVY